MYLCMYIIIIPWSLINWSTQDFIAVRSTHPYTDHFVLLAGPFDFQHPHSFKTRRVNSTLCCEQKASRKGVPPNTY
jgi:hypothetical protein